MLLITVLFALLLIRIWGSGAPVQKDGWFFAIHEFFSEFEALARRPCGTVMAAVIASLVAVYFVHSLLASISGWFAALFAVVIFIYATGRGDWAVSARQYISAWHGKDWAAASVTAQELGVSAYDIDGDDWAELNHRLVAALAYQGFERLFVILFWFCLGGVLPILAYRLIALSRDETEDADEEEQLSRVLWILEWPALRVFGLSLAITGNFSSCFARFKQFLTDTTNSTQQTLVFFVESALSVAEQEVQDPRFGERELREILHLYSRTMVLWVCVIALFAIFF
ncbi:regulatory signaling modulator protein AmpE [Halioxenophilus aromaticivorans]|uniref:Regulatory signaling modulator protein AmpE n=1 Tax=Halioxenophilus aromaticivorans TaxID=1306992 RepID=A0AAV3TYP8_9ALTE